MVKIDKILFPSDLTCYSTAGLEFALTMSKLYDAKLYVLHIVDTASYAEINGSTPEMDELYLSLEENKRIEMNRYIRENLKDNTKVIQTLRFGRVDEEIIKYAEQGSFDLIIMEDNSSYSKAVHQGAGVIEKVLIGTNIPVLKTYNHGVISETKIQSFADRNYQLNTFGRSLFN